MWQMLYQTCYEYCANKCWYKISKTLNGLLYFAHVFIHD